MKTLPKFGYNIYSIAIIAGLFIGVPFCGKAQSEDEVYASTTKAGESEVEMSETNYLVTGVFLREDQAANYCEILGKKGCPSKVGYWKERDMYFCYATKSNSYKPVKDKFNQLRKEKGFSDVWILKLGESDQKSVDTGIAIPQQVKTEIKNEPQEVVAEVKKISSGKEEVEKARVINYSEQEFTDPEIKKVEVPIVKTLPNHPNLLKTHNVYDIEVNVKDKHNRPVPASVQVLGEDETKVIATLKSDHSTYVKINKKENQNVKLACEIFGYHKTIIELPLGDADALTEMDNIKLLGDRISVEFPLEAVHKGDLMVMFNVFFHPNSNILRTNSKNELETLLTIMQDNPNLKIRIHGHTNGKGGGPIVKINGNNEDLFDPKDVEHTRGSAVKLSEYRADAIRLYLIKNGIAQERIEVRGWGGKKMIYKSDSPHYKLNARVEVEILDI